MRGHKERGKAVVLSQSKELDSSRRVRTGNKSLYGLVENRPTSEQDLVLINQRHYQEEQMDNSYFKQMVELEKVERWNSI